MVGGRSWLAFTIFGHFQLSAVHEEPLWAALPSQALLGRQRSSSDTSETIPNYFSDDAATSQQLRYTQGAIRRRLTVGASSYVTFVILDDFSFQQCLQSGPRRVPSPGAAGAAPEAGR